MMTVILVVHILIALALISVVLAQKSAGGIGMGTGGAGANPFGKARAKGNSMTRLTGYLGAAFFVTSLGLALIAQPQTGSSPATLLEDKGSVPTFDAPSAPQADAPAEPVEPVVPQAE